MVKRIAYLFSGQGTQSKDMGAKLLRSLPRASKFSQTWDDAREYLHDSYSFDLNYLVKENPCVLKYRRTPNDPLETKRCSNGLLNFTPFTQAALLTYHVALYNQMERGAGAYGLFAGHSLGEISSLAALGMISLHDALDCVFKRGWLINSCVSRNFKGISPFKTIVVNPARCEISESLFLTIVEAISKPLMEQRAELLEITCYNVQNYQYVVSGSDVPLAILGKILDPGWRRKYFQVDSSSQNSSQKEPSAFDEQSDRIHEFVGIVRHALSEVDVSLDHMQRMEIEFHDMMEQATSVSGSPKRAKRQGRHQCMSVPRNPELDNEKKILFTETLEHDMGLGSFAMDGLKKKPWFFPVQLGDTPFHSSILNKATHEWEEVLQQKLSSSDDAYKILDKVDFIPNLLGHPLRKDSSVHESIITSLTMENIGETWSKCRSGYPPLNHSVPPMQYKEMLISLLSKHLSAAVQWSETLSHVIHPSKAACDEIVEVSPTPLFGRMVSQQAKTENIPPKEVRNLEEIILGNI